MPVSYRCTPIRIVLHSKGLLERYWGCHGHIRIESTSSSVHGVCRFLPSQLRLDHAHLVAGQVASQPSHSLLL